jgi:molybdate transport system substrate-binding protein
MVRASWAAVCTVLAAGCSQSDGGLTVSAAASLQPALTEVARMYSTPITLNFGASGMLAQQIEQGAPADVFFSAANAPMDRLDARGLLLAGSRKDVLRNEVVLIVPPDAPVRGFADIATNKVRLLALGDPASVPVGEYGREILTAMGIWDAVQPKLLLAKDVRQVLTYVETGNADAGIVYATDARISSKVRVAATAPESTHAPALYPIAVVAASRRRAAARGFVAWVSGSLARPIFARYGFQAAN